MGTDITLMTGRSKTKLLTDMPDVTISRRRRGRHGRRLNVAEKVVWLLVAVVVLKTWCLEGLFGPLVVPGGSMATTLLGTHRKVVCQDCGFEFDRGIEPQETAERAVCPNCGYAGNDISGTGDVWGDRVLMHKSVFFLREPRVWEVVAFRDPAQADRIMVKRVVGLPGESISIEHGEVYANGKIRRKPLWLQRAMAVLVHDAEFSTFHHVLHHSNWITDRWAADGADSQWGFADGKFAHPESAAGGKTEWLTYCHGRPSGSLLKKGATAGLSSSECRKRPESTAGQASSGTQSLQVLLSQQAARKAALGEAYKYIPGPITDLCGYNQTRPRRNEDVHTVGDLMLSLHVLKLFGKGSLSIRASDNRSEFLIRLNVEPVAQSGNVKTCEANLPTDLRRASIETWRDGRPLHELECPSFTLPDESNADGFAIEVSLFDRRLLVAVDGQVVVNYPYEHAPTSADVATNSQGNPGAGCRPLAVGCDGLGVTLGGVRVYRDVYYITPTVGVRNAKKGVCTRLGDDEYYVLGDNSPISSDSRNWPGGPAVCAKLLVGKPLAVHIPFRRVVLAGREFQVPDIGRIRYIR